MYLTLFSTKNYDTTSMNAIVDCKICDADWSFLQFHCHFRVHYDHVTISIGVNFVCTFLHLGDFKVGNWPRLLKCTGLYMKETFESGESCRISIDRNRLNGLAEKDVAENPGQKTSN